LADAAADLSEAACLQPKDFLPWYELALVQLVRGETVAYRETCQRMMQAIEPSNAAEIEYFVAWTCCLTAAGLDDWSQVIKRARFSADQQPTATAYQTGLGAALLRAGRLDEAIDVLTETNRLLDDPVRMKTPGGSPAYTWYLLAMAYHAQGNEKEAKDWLAKATAWTEEALAKHESRTHELHWPRRATLQLLQTEANALITAVRPGLREGEAPAEP
jgi:tetratricopeptide (TPR) repeat protein